MKNRLVNIALVLLVLSFVTSCKKETDEQIDHEPESYTVVKPPLSSYYIGVMNEDFGYAVWTTDFIKFNRLTTQFKSVKLVRVDNDTVLLTDWDGQNIYYAALDDLNNFQQVSYEYEPQEFSIYNGVILAYAVDGNNYYTGYCDTKLGETSISYTLLPAGISFNRFKNVGSAVIATITTNGSAQMAYTYDGEQWHVPGTLSGSGEFDYFNGKVWRFNTTSWDYTSDTSLETAVWTNDFIDYQSYNTSDTIGGFSFGVFQAVSENDWRIYGVINSSSGNYPCVNISTDLGQSWQKTKLLTGFNYNGNLQDMRSTTSKSLHRTSTNELYISENGVDFNKVTDQEVINNNNNFFGQYVR